MLPILVLVLLSGLSGVAAAGIVGRWPQADPGLSATRAIGEELGRRGRVRRFLQSRLDPSVATGLALSAAVLFVVVAGAIIGVVIYMVRTDSGVVSVDRSVARWAAAHAATGSTHILSTLTQVGSTPIIVGLAIAAGAFGVWRWHRASILLFLTLVVGGQFLISNLIKFAVDRARPDVHLLSALSTPSFPSGHSTAAAATFAALALLLGRGGSPTTRMMLTGLAVSIAVAVACSRVFLGVHWFSDAIAGLVLGWAWFSICAVAFGGRLLLFGAPAEAVAAGPSRTDSSLAPQEDP